MNLWIITTIIGLLALTAIVVVNTGNVNADSPEAISCDTCGNGCTSERNCGLSNCGVVSGTGSCGCGR